MSATDQSIIIHPGIVDHIEKGKVFVRILSQSACSTCHSKGICSVSDVEEKIVEVDVRNEDSYHKGDQVTVRMQLRLGNKAVMLGYVIPLVILVASIITFVLIFDNEGLAALLSLLMLVPYYFILYLLRKKLKQQFSFTLYPGD
jgi:sigma-E factor negative regulatory protein RseC